MMGQRKRQIGMLIMNMKKLIPHNHLLRRINSILSFEFVYDILAPYYLVNGRPSVGPVCMFKMP